MLLFTVDFQPRPCIRSLRGPRAWLKGHLMLAPVAQLDRALPSEGRGHRFKSYRVRQHAISKYLPENSVKLRRQRRAAAEKLLFLFAISFLPVTTNAAESPTIASTSLCGDSYLQALAPKHIAALSWQSRSPLSRATPAQRKLPQLWDDPEVLFNTVADIILFGSGEGRLSSQLGAKTVMLNWGEDFTVIQSNADAISEALSLPSDITAEWVQRMETLTRRSAERGRTPKVLYLSRSGGSAGKGTLVDSAIAAAGGENIVKNTGWFTPDPEEIIAYEPDLIITSYFENGYESVQSTAMRNKIVQRYIADHNNIHIDGSLWPCAGPGLIEAAELISEAIDVLP